MPSGNAQQRRNSALAAGGEQAVAARAQRIQNLVLWTDEDATLGQEIRIRAAVDGDVEQLADMSASVQELHVAGRPDVFKTADPEVLSGLFRRRLAESTVRIWIAEMAGVLVGYAVTVDKRQEENAHAHARSWREIEEIAVRVEYRRRGIASALLRHVEVATRADGISVVELNTWAFNEAAQRSFERLGFVPKHVRYERRT
jgi:diamine N-acetyltransferase